MDETKWDVHAALRWAEEQLADTSEATLAARLLLAHILGCTLTDLFVHPERALSDREVAAYRQAIARRAHHEPVAYIVGHRAFMHLDLLVDKRVLIPRPETELLVERAVKLASQWPNPRIADVGTGSGAIAIALATRLPRARIVATDNSAAALDLARDNAARHGVSGRITFLHGNLLAPLDAPVDLIVANLPYVSEREYVLLPPDIRLYEPRAALVGGTDGLAVIGELLHTAHPYLTAGGEILIEIGARQGNAVRTLASQAFPRAKIKVLRDYAGHERIVQVTTCTRFSTRSHAPAWRRQPGILR